MNRRALVACAIVGGVSWSGCSALIQPDTSRLHEGEDAAIGTIDAEPLHDAAPDHDAGPEHDAGPGNDAGEDAGHDAGLDVDAWSDIDGGHDAGSDVGVDAAMSCTGPATCVSGVASRCMGPMRVSETCALGCAAVEPRCAIFVPSNVNGTLFDGTASDATLDTMVTVDTSACIGIAGTRVAMQGDGSEVCVALVRDLRITPSGLLRVTGSRPLAILATGSVRIDGRIDASAVRVLPGAGGGRGSLPMSDATGDGAGFDGSETGFADSGGGGGGGSGSGGDGGEGYMTFGGFGSLSAGADDLIPLTGGSGGGLGPGSEATARIGNSGLGGAGGGAVQISSQVSIRVDGAILAAGGGGGGGGNDGTIGTGNFGAGGGGGSGGGILLEAPVLDVRGRLWTTGGGGGGGASSGGPGGNGVDGRDATTGGAVGGLSGGARYGAAGGRSGALAASDGSDGESNTQTSANGGGGGGAAGRIVLRDATGSYTPDVGAVLSPNDVGLTILRVLTR